MAEKTVSAVVARGRTVHHGDADGKAVAYGPGKKVSLPKGDVDRLREAGFLENEDGTQETASGPIVKSDAPGSVTSES